MRSFAIIALATGINAAAVDYAVSTPVYEASTPAYPEYTPAYVASSVPAYAASSAKYEESTPAYAASTPVYSAYSASSAGYAASSVPAYSAASSYAVYPVTSTKVVKETTFVVRLPSSIMQFRKLTLHTVPYTHRCHLRGEDIHCQQGYYPHRLVLHHHRC